MSGRVQREFPPHVLREYALIADGERGALCGPRGEIVWMCAPRWDSDAVLSGLVGGAGAYAVTPSETFVWGGYYEAGSLIWHNRWVTTSAVVECRDALAYPGDRHRLVLLRRVAAPEADTEVEVLLDLRAGFGRRAMRQLRRDGDGVWSARTGELYVCWSGAAAAEPDGSGALRMRLQVPAGTAHDLVLEVSDQPLPDPVAADPAWAGTESSWQQAVPRFDDSIAPRDARHAYAVLRGLTRPGGGMVAAATLGLPERAEAGRNYDYRYVWLRDQALAGLAVSVDQPHPLLDDAVAFATQRLLEHGGRLPPAYRLDGGETPHEQTLDLPGYPGGRCVVGNWVRGQFQLDVLGELLQLFAAADRHDHLDSDARRAVQVAVAGIEDGWQRDDAGVWELHDAWWTHSRLSCVAGLRAIGARLPRAEGARVVGLAETVLAETTHRCIGPHGGWTRSPQQPGSDAALVLPAVRGALPASDPRSEATLERVGRDLAVDGYVYRFAPDARPLGEAEGAFLVCGFWMALAQWQRGDIVAAHRWFERNRAASGPPGLLAEEYDVAQRQLRGNLPQAFVHAALLETSLRLGTPPGEGSTP